MLRRYQPLMISIMLVLLASLPILGEPYYLKFVTRILIFGLAALALDLVVGYAGLVSLGHAAFFGVGAYVVGILAANGVTSAWLVWPAAMAGAGAAAAVIGMLSLRTTGIYFIFITLAFAQMLFYAAQSLRQYGGDDGFALAAPTKLGFGLTTANTVALYASVLVVVIVALWVCLRLTASQFGKVILAARDNKRRALAIGFNVYPYQVVLFSISGALTGLAGALDAALAEYIAPSSMSWIVSGDLLMMVILGSAGTLIGPILGAAIFVSFEQIMASYTTHWMLLLGPLLVARVLFLQDGILGLIGARVSRAA